MTRNNCLSPKEAGADCIVTPCPLCQMQMDAYHQAHKKALTRTSPYPSCICHS
ncbi:heterodisulfide reductase-related iron-sulfur binding cluster [Sporolactobacillus shoreicorticis]|uniref:Heterodisulfide reductase-related iron-sulfur binding cluster n=1 Tax=Sporolactobacillus shoreicorticis TaxID=1923877 RepID=A0ABW5RXK8_9BACL|nr:heterodisulfide reductase-related iron-sulfur binding cluster [Sporolactobacillus shoreicorticis]MCO7124775.1 heterodisulfide reductase-related iron-sulfur binding cluster [Sporolactobacillus shoreicorticis]